MTPTNEFNPGSWWRQLCEVTDRLFICGDLPHLHVDPEGFHRVLAGWVDAGITHIVDVRGEADDTVDVSQVAPHIKYVWLGTHDEGGDQDFSWFDDGVAAVTLSLIHI